MKVLIVEDEKLAREHLAHQLTSIEPEVEILAKLDSVQSTVQWLQSNQAELIFLDIHLADDLSFKIFDQIKVDTPIIFTTAFDQYALRAFKVNSIDYLLKPIDTEELKAAIEKYKATKTSLDIDYQKLAQIIERKEVPNYQERFLVTKGDKVMSLKTNQVAYFEGEDRYVYLTNRDGKRFIIDYNLNDLESLLDPKHFFRLNRSFITQFDSIDKIITLSKSRLKVELSPTARREIFISAAKNRAFKMWLNQ